MKKNFTVTFLFHLLFLALAVFLVLFFQSVQAGPLPAGRIISPAFSVSITPNPVHSMMKVTVSGAEANETVLLEIFRKSGDLVYQGTMRITGPKTVKKIPRPTADPGLYYYRITRKKNSQTVSGRIAFQ